MVFSEVCRICLRVNVRLCVLKKTSLRNLYKILTNCLMDEDEEPIIVCFICHAKLIRCRTLQQQAIESNAVLEQLLAGESVSIPKLHEARDEIQFTPVYHIDIRPVECDIENDCKDDIFSLESVKVEEEKIKNENLKSEVNWSHETDTAEKQEDLEIDAFEDRHKDLEDNLPIIAFGAKSKTNDVDIAPPEKKIKSNSTNSKISVVRRDNLDFEGPTIKSNLKQPGEKPFSCNTCKFRSNTKCNLRSHMKIHTGEKPFSAPSEKKIKSNSTNSKISVVRRDNLDFEGPTIKSNLKQPGEKPFSCNTCKFRSNTKSNLRSHMKIHTGEKPFSCNICKFRSITKRDLQRHITIHTGEKPFSCNICEFRCNAKSSLQNHMRIHTGEKPFSCNMCERRCRTKGRLQRHMKIHTGEKPFSAPSEKKIKSNSTNSKISVVRRDNLDFEGPTIKSNLKQPEEKPFSCNTCKFRSNTKCNLRSHMKIHTGEKPFSCNICKFRSITKRDLQRHITIHTGEKPFSCNICEFRCNAKSSLQNHMRIHTGEKPFSCNMCERRCRTKGRLQTHMKIHTGEKPFSCNICQFRFTRKDNLQTHMNNKHTEKKPFSCNICEFRCNTKSNLLNHMNIHTGEKPKRRKRFFM